MTSLQSSGQQSWFEPAHEEVWWIPQDPTECGLSCGAICRNRSESTLPREMDIYLTATSHYPNQCWLRIKEDLWHSLETNVTANDEDIIMFNEFDNYLNSQGPMSYAWNHWSRQFVQLLAQADTKGNNKALHYWWFVKGIHRWPALKVFPSYDVIMWCELVISLIIAQTYQTWVRTFSLQSQIHWPKQNAWEVW